MNTLSDMVGYVGGPLDGSVERRSKGARLARFRGHTGMTVSIREGEEQMRKIANGRDGDRHYVLVRTGENAIYVHTSVYRDVVAS